MSDEANLSVNGNRPWWRRLEAALLAGALIVCAVKVVLAFQDHSWDRAFWWTALLVFVTVGVTREWTKERGSLDSSGAQSEEGDAWDDLRAQRFGAAAVVLGLVALTMFILTVTAAVNGFGSGAVWCTVGAVGALIVGGVLVSKWRSRYLAVAGTDPFEE